VRELAPDLRPDLTGAMGLEGDLVELRERRLSRCFVATRRPEILGYGWLSEHPEWIGEIRLEISPGAQEAYLWNCVTLPAHRRTGIFTSLLILVAGRLQARGLVRLWIASAGGAEKALANAGFVPILQLGETRLLGIRRLKATPAAGADAELVESALDVLRLGRKPLSGLLGRVPPSRRH
jgi:GNAT superfamily N-acetyltransferase